MLNCFAHGHSQSLKCDISKMGIAQSKGQKTQLMNDNNVNSKFRGGGGQEYNIT